MASRTWPASNTVTMSREAAFKEQYLPHYSGDGKVDFVAYYPYTTRSPKIPTPINLTNNHRHRHSIRTAIEQSKHNPHVALTFTHQLSQVVLSLTAADDISLEGISITIENARTHGTMNLSDGTIELGTTTGIIAPVTTVDIVENSAVATAILLPGQAMDDLLVRFELADESTYLLEAHRYYINSQHLLQMRT